MAAFAFRAIAASATFDAASVKVSNAPDAVMFFGTGTLNTATGTYRVPSAGGSVIMNNWTLGSLIAAAWDLGSGQLSGPDWLNSDRYDVSARTSPQTTQAELRTMLQALLAERFQLATHRESKTLPVYVLTVDKGGSKLHIGTGDQQSPVLFAPPSRLIGHSSTLQSLANALRRPTGRTVIDKSGISGNFDFTLTWTPDTNVQSPDAAADAGPSIFTAVREQLGLRLEPEKSQVDVLVVDRANRVPVAN